MQDEVGMHIEATLPKHIDLIPRRVINEVTQEVFENVLKRVAVHTKTGNLERSISHSVLSDTHGQVIQGDTGTLTKDGRNYGVFVHYGFKAHDIKPKNKKALRWVAGGGFRFAKSVSHPGYKGDPFMDKGVADTNVNQIIKRIADDELQADL